METGVTFESCIKGGGVYSNEKDKTIGFGISYGRGIGGHLDIGFNLTEYSKTSFYQKADAGLNKLRSYIKGRVTGWFNKMFIK